MKIGITYLFTISKFGYPPSIEGDLAAMDTMSELGFHYLEMEGLGEEHTQGVWENRELLKRKLESLDIHIHNFCAVDPLLVSMDKGQRWAAYERFRKTAQIGAYFGTETLHLASYAPPVIYTGSAPYKLGEDYEIRDSYALTIPEGFRWQAVWDVLVESCTMAADIAGEIGKTVIMEPRVGEIICSVDSMLRLIDDVGRPNFKANFDTGHFSAQRENVPLALMKLEGKFANIHISDNHPVNAHHIAVGDGVIDWHEFFRILKAMNYNGYLGVDLSESPTLDRDIERSVLTIRRICEEMDIEIQK